MNTQSATTSQSIAEILSNSLGIPLVEIPSRYRANCPAVLSRLGELRETMPKKVTRWEESILSGMEKPIPQASRLEAETVETVQAEIVTVPRKRKPAPMEEETEGEEIPLEDVTGEPLLGKVPRIAILGQENASFLLQGFINSFAETGEFSKAILLTADAGTGKTHTFNVLTSALSTLTSEQINVVECGAASGFATIEAEPSQAFLQALDYSSKGIYTVCKIDEAQLLSSCGTAMRRVFECLIYGAGEGWKVSGSVTVGKKTYHYNGRFLALVLITNQPEAIAKRNQAAVKRRFLNIPLCHYTSEVMKKLTPLYFKEKGFQVEPDALKELVKFHRGTLVALDDFLSRADGHIGGTKVISKGVFDKVEPSCDYTLRGFTRTEIKALRWLSATTEPRTKAGLERSFAGLDVTEFYRHSKRQETKTKDKGAINTPFVLISGSEYQVTETGLAFLNKNPNI